MKLNLNQSLKAPKILLTKACNHYVYCINFLDCWHHWTAVNNLELSDTIWVQLSFELSTANVLFTTVHCLDSYLTVSSWQHIAQGRMESEIRLPNPEFWISESFGLVPGKFYHSLLHIKDRRIVDSLMNGNSRIGQEYRLRILMSRNVEQLCPKVTIGYWYRTVATVNDCEHQKLAFPTLRLPTSLSETAMEDSDWRSFARQDCTQEPSMSRYCIG